MDVRELRIGSYLQYFGNVVQVEGIVNEADGYGIQLSGGDFASIKSNSLEPIPLDEDWLVKFGGVSSQHNWLIGDKIELSYISTDEYYEYEWKSPFLDWQIIKLEHVHTLQNLYFALTGEELTFKNQ